MPYPISAGQMYRMFAAAPSLDPSPSDGNNADTRVLLHFDDAAFANTAIGAPPGANVTNAGSVALADGGKFGKCAYFPGDANSRLLLNYTAAELNAATGCRIDIWFKPDDGQPHRYAVLFSTTENTGDHHALELGFDGSSTIGIMLSRYNYSYQPLSGNWEHTAFIKHGGTWYGYFNGQRVASSTYTLTEDGLIKFGNRTYGGDVRRYKGWIDEFRIQLGDMSEFTGETIPVPDKPF